MEAVPRLEGLNIIGGPAAAVSAVSAVPAVEGLNIIGGRLEELSSAWRELGPASCCCSPAAGVSMAGGPGAGPPLGSSAPGAEIWFGFAIPDCDNTST